MQSGQKRFFLLFLLGQFFMLVGVHPLAAMCFIVLAAWHWLRGERPKAWGVVLLSGIVSAIVMASLGLGLRFIAASSLGCLIGVLSERRWPYGWRLMAVTGLAFAGVAAFIVVAWQSMLHDTTIFMNARIAELAQQESASEQMLDAFRWCGQNYTYIVMGSVFGSILLMVACTLCVVDRWSWNQDERSRRKTTGFQRMRLPDWLVWVAIAVALLWFVERRWPNEALRVVTWNTAVGLAWVYGLNGFSILLYGLTVLKATTLASVAIIGGVFMFLMHLLALVGLFDTWYDFRVRFRRLAMLRRVAHRSADREG